MNNADAALHVRGESQFLDDRAVPEGTLHAAVVSSPIAHGKIIRLDPAPVEQMENIHAIITADNIPGINQIGCVIPDEPLLADGNLCYVGQPIAVVVGGNATIARKAARAIALEFQVLPAIFDAREAYAQGHLIAPPVTSSLGDIDDAWEKCDIVVEGRVESGGQEHIYMETQGALACPTESGGLKVTAGTQAPSVVQQAIAQVLNLPIHQVEVDVPRLGGGFGGKEEQATAWAVMASLAAFQLKKPVKLVLSRDEDMRMTGKRHPYASDFKIGLTKDAKILAYEVSFYQNAGAVAGLSPSVLDRTLFHCTHAYFVPNVRATGFSCRTHLPPNTAFRGFGTPQAAFVMESAIFKAAEKMGVDPALIQKNNLIQEGEPFHYGMKVENSQVRRCWEEAETRYQTELIYQAVQNFNRTHQAQKKGVAMMPLCYGISFEKGVFLNQAYALVHIYTDGSVAVSSGGVEMGQGLSTKLRHVASRIFSISLAKIRIETVNTARVANTSPTSASFSTDLNGHAIQLACQALVARLKKFIAQRLNTIHSDDIEIKDEIVYLRGNSTEFTWEKLVSDAYLNRINLSAQAHYAAPKVYFDKEKNKGDVYAYHVFGSAVIEVTLDCIRGTYQTEAVKVVHDFGQSLNPLIDLGQVEGGIVQGLGWITMEELRYNDQGYLMSGDLSTYKVPDIYSTPQQMQISFLAESNNGLGIFNSKAVGEPPLLYSIGVYFATLKAIKAFRSDVLIMFSIPMTPEKVLLSLYD